MRIIARLDIKNNFVIKGINLEGLRKVGTPNNLAKKYYDEGADELIYMDCVASLYERSSLEKVLKDASKNIFIPFAVGGGIRSLNDAIRMFSNGADKIAINSAAIDKPQIFGDMVQKFGGQSIMLSIEAKKINSNKWVIYKNYGREKTNIDVFDWIKKISQYEIGEILLTSIDYEGLANGYDIDLYKQVSKITKIPLIASGGFGKLVHITNLVKEARVDAITISRQLHYDKIKLKEIKEYCSQNKIFVRKSYE
tara:strand:+ start:74 stop:832 length:759 start_codon:yes stop_codon:yes gene_type:complete